MSRTICIKYCPYYRNDKEDVGYCFPFKVLSNIEYLTDYSESRVFENRYSALKDIFCQNCAFYPIDCDFNNGSDGLPCGGYIFAEILIKNGTIDIDGIKELSQNIR